MQKVLNLVQVGFSSARPKLHIFEKGGRHSMSGIRATIYGATGFVGPYIGSQLGSIGSEIVFPHQHW